jgi:hypothetical protein
MSGARMDISRKLSGNETFRRSGEVVCRQVGTESILVPIRQNVGNLDFVYTLSPVAARVWSLLDGKNTVEAIVESVVAEYEVSRETAMTDVEVLLADLAEVSLITSTP